MMKKISSLEIGDVIFNVAPTYITAYKVKFVDHSVIVVENIANGKAWTLNSEPKWGKSSLFGSGTAKCYKWSHELQRAYDKQNIIPEIEKLYDKLKLKKQPLDELRKLKSQIEKMLA